MPLLQTVFVDRIQGLDVQQVEADLDVDVRAVADGQEVLLVTLLDAGGRQGRERLIGPAEEVAECAPLPAPVSLLGHAATGAAA